MFLALLDHIYFILNSLSFNITSSSLYEQSETKLYNGSDKDVSASGGKLTKKESLKVIDLLNYFLKLTNPITFLHILIRLEKFCEIAI